MTDRISRRHLLGAGAAFGTASFLPVSGSAQNKQLVAATFPGTWNEAHRQYLAPAFTKKTGASVTQSILLGNDQLSRLTAAKGGKPPFDVALFDAPQVLDAAKQGLIVEYPAAKSPNYKDLLPEFQDKWGPCISLQIIGIGYNPKKIKTPPTSWDALWEPKYKGRVGLTALNSQLGIASSPRSIGCAAAMKRISSQHSRRCVNCCRTSARSAPTSAPMPRCGSRN